MNPAFQKTIERRTKDQNVWLGYADNSAKKNFNRDPFNYEILPTESAVGQAMFDELITYSESKTGDIVIVLLGGRGAQAMYRIINDLSQTDEIDELLAR